MNDEKELMDQLNKARATPFSASEWVSSRVVKLALLALLRPEFPENEGYNQAIWDAIGVVKSYEDVERERKLREYGVI